MKHLIRNIMYFGYLSLKIASHWIKLLKVGNPYSPYAYKQRCEKGKKLAILANGPSLKDAIEKIENCKDFADVDFSVMNYFATERLFKIIKPKYYSLADPMFFKKDSRYDNVMNLFKILNEEVDWPMTLYIPNSISYSKFLEYSKLCNQYITIVPIWHVFSNSTTTVKNYFFKKGLSSPHFITVALLSIYTGINNGYKHIDLYGADMTFFDSLHVNEKNQLCYKYSHFYDNKTEYRRVTFDDAQPCKISYYIKGISRMFIGYDELADYAKYVGTTIINHSPISLLDCFPRGTKVS